MTGAGHWTFFSPFFVWTMDITKGTGLLQFTPFLKSLWAPLHVPWIKPNQQPSLRQPHTFSLTSEIREKIRKEKDRKLMGWDRKCLIGKEKAAHRSKSKHALLSMGRQVLPSPGQKRSITWEDKRCDSKCTPHFFILRLTLYPEHSIEHPFG